MSWGNDKNTIICEECGHEDRPEAFVWVFGDLAICQNGSACHHRQEMSRWVEARNNIKARNEPSRIKTLIAKFMKREKHDQPAA